jgi:hypothetical protein
MKSSINVGDVLYWRVNYMGFLGKIIKVSIPPKMKHVSRYFYSVIVSFGMQEFEGHYFKENSDVRKKVVDVFGSSQKSVLVRHEIINRVFTDDHVFMRLGL